MVKPSLRNVDVATRSIISAWLIDHVKVRALLLQRALLGFAALCLVLAVVGDGAWRYLAGLAMLTFAFLGFGGMAVRWLAITGIKRLAAPRQFGEFQDEINEVIEAADLPTTPLSALRLVFRLRRGVKAEVDRLQALASQVKTIIQAPPPPG